MVYVIIWVLFALFLSWLFRRDIAEQIISSKVEGLTYFSQSALQNPNEPHFNIFQMLTNSGAMQELNNIVEYVIPQSIVKIEWIKAIGGPIYCRNSIKLYSKKMLIY